MGILEAAKPVAIICTRDRARAAIFYRDTLGIRMKLEDHYAVVFEVGGVDLRVSTVADFTPHEHTMLGFRVPDVALIRTSWVFSLCQIRRCAQPGSTTPMGMS
jgi:hypothetical protein